MITFINISSTREFGESVLFKPVLKAYPTYHFLAHHSTHLPRTSGTTLEIIHQADGQNMSNDPILIDDLLHQLTYY